MKQYKLLCSRAMTHNAAVRTWVVALYSRTANRSLNTGTEHHFGTLNEYSGENIST